MLHCIEIRSMQSEVKQSFFFSCFSSIISIFWVNEASESSLISKQQKWIPLLLKYGFTDKGFGAKGNIFKWLRFNSTWVLFLNTFSEGKKTFSPPSEIETTYLSSLIVSLSLSHTHTLSLPLSLYVRVCVCERESVFLRVEKEGTFKQCVCITIQIYLVSQICQKRTGTNKKQKTRDSLKER